MLIDSLLLSMRQNLFGWALFIFFYAFVGFFIYKNRKKIQRQGIVFLYRTKAGIKLIDKISKQKFWKYWGYTGIFFGFAGMAFISFYLIYLVVKFISMPRQMPAAVQFVLPTPVAVSTGPLLGIPIATFVPVLLVVILVHEGCHGIISRVHQLKIMSTGLGFFIILPLAFVEPDEKSLEKAKTSRQLSVYAAGPFANICAALLSLLIFIVLFTPILSQGSVVYSRSDNPIVISTMQGSPLSETQISAGEKILSINGKEIHSAEDIGAEMQQISAGDKVIIKTDRDSYEIYAKLRPDSEIAYIGIYTVDYEPRSFLTTWFGSKFIMPIVRYTREFFQWLILLNLGIGLFNLLPIGPVDGGRMLYAVLLHISNKNNKLLRANSYFFS